MPRIKMSLTTEGWKEDTAIVNMMRKYALKKLGYIATRALINKIEFINVMGFTLMIHRWLFTSGNIDILWPIFQLIGVFASPPSFTLPVEIVSVLVLFLFHWSPPVPIILCYLLEIWPCVVFIDFLNTFYDKACQKAQLYWSSSCL